MTVAMPLFDAHETVARLPYPALARAIVEAMADLAAGRLIAPPRQHIELPVSTDAGPDVARAGAVLLIMAAADTRITAIKTLTVHAANRRHPELGLSSLQSEVLVLDTATGRRLGMLDGSTLTARRTAGLSLAAAMHTVDQSKGDPGPLLVMGAGVQATAHVQAFHEGLGVNRVAIRSRTPASAQRLAEFARGLGMEADVLESDADLTGYPLVVTATTSAEPVLPGRPQGLHPRVRIFAVGAYRSHMTELPAELVHRCRIVVDTLEGARSEAGDLIQARVDFAQVTPLAELKGTEWAGHDGPVLFKSVGHAACDLAAARLAFPAEH